MPDLPQIPGSHPSPDLSMHFFKNAQRTPHEAIFLEECAARFRPESHLEYTNFLT
jgi:hypothetical protein